MPQLKHLGLLSVRVGTCNISLCMDLISFRKSSFFFQSSIKTLAPNWGETSSREGQTSQSLYFIDLFLWDFIDFLFFSRRFLIFSKSFFFSRSFSDFSRKFFSLKDFFYFFFLIVVFHFLLEAFFDLLSFLVVFSFRIKLSTVSFFVQFSFYSFCFKRCFLFIWVFFIINEFVPL